MKRTILFTSVLLAIAFTTQAQFKTPTLYLQAGFALPTKYMADYYNLGLGGDLQCLLPVKKSGLTKISLLANTGYYTFNGKERFDYVSGNILKADRIGYVPLHAGVRFDFAAEQVGMYASYAYGLTNIIGPTGGSRTGHDINLGMWLGRFDCGMGFNTWTGSKGDKFHFISFKLGVRLR
jgi:hypothetical protein